MSLRMLMSVFPFLFLFNSATFASAVRVPSRPPFKLAKPSPPVFLQPRLPHRLTSSRQASGRTRAMQWNPDPDPWHDEGPRSPPSPSPEPVPRTKQNHSPTSIQIWTQADQLNSSIKKSLITALHHRTVAKASNLESRMHTAIAERQAIKNRMHRLQATDHSQQADKHELEAARAFYGKGSDEVLAAKHEIAAYHEDRMGMHRFEQDLHGRKAARAKWEQEQHLARAGEARVKSDVSREMGRKELRDVKKIRGLRDEGYARGHEMLRDEKVKASQKTK